MELKLLNANGQEGAAVSASDVGGSLAHSPRCASSRLLVFDPRSL